MAPTPGKGLPANKPVPPKQPPPSQVPTEQSKRHSAFPDHPRPNRTFPRRFNAADAARIFVYAVRSGANPQDILIAISNALKDEAKQQALLILQQQTQSTPLPDAFHNAIAPILNWIPPIGVAVDTAASLYNRLHAFGTLLAPSLTARWDQSIAFLLHEAQHSQEAESLRTSLTNLLVKVDALETKGRQKIAEVLDALADSPLAHGISALNRFIKGLVDGKK